MNLFFVPVTMPCQSSSPVGQPIPYMAFPNEHITPVLPALPNDLLNSMLSCIFQTYSSTLSENLTTLTHPSTSSSVEAQPDAYHQYFANSSHLVEASNLAQANERESTIQLSQEQTPLCISSQKSCHATSIMPSGSCHFEPGSHFSTHEKESNKNFLPDSDCHNNGLEKKRKMVLPTEGIDRNDSEIKRREESSEIKTDDPELDKKARLKRNSNNYRKKLKLQDELDKQTIKAYKNYHSIVSKSLKNISTETMNNLREGVDDHSSKIEQYQSDLREIAKGNADLKDALFEISKNFS